MRPRPEDLPYRPCVGVMLLDPQGRVFVGRRIDRETEAWQMPQGGIDPGEDPRAAALRELAEETGVVAAEIVAELDEWLAYDLPPHLVGRALHGKYRGQSQKWFALRFTGADRDIDIATAHPEFDAWRWVDIDELTDVVVPFKRDVYARVVRAFRRYAKP